jgi:hypothetical protein
MFPWLPTLSVIFLASVGLTWASSPPVTVIGRRLCMACLLVGGLLAIVGSVWQERSVADDTLAVTGTTTSPASQTVSELTNQVEALEDRVRLLEKHKQVRIITHEAAENFTAYLKQFGGRRVLVSCIPDDIEAYQYANQLVNVLRAGDWDAHGPEVTKIFGDVRAPGINVYVSPDDHSDTAKILFDGFAKFNIPYQARVTPVQAIPDIETVELFIGQQQSERVRAGGD